MNINTESKTVIETTGHFKDGKLKTHPNELGEWYGDETCKEINFNREIENIGVPNGEYKITITLERVSNDK